MKKLLALLLMLSASSVYGAFSIQLDAGKLKMDATHSMSTGSLLIFITAGPDGIFETPTGLKAGSFVAGDDVLLSVIAESTSGSPFNTSGGTDETINLFTITNVTPPAGQLLGLMWFPGITYTQWQAGATPTAGQVFGFYNPTFYGNGNSNPDGGNPWTVPNAGSLISLNFFTTDSDLGGSQLPSEGFADFLVSPVPEPSTWSLLGLGGLSSIGLTMLRARRRHS